MVLLVVDTQKLIMTTDLYEFQLLENRIKILIEKARNKKIEVIYVRHDDGIGNALTKRTYGYEIYDSFKPVPGEKIFDKSVNSAFKETGLLDYLRTKDENTIIVVGLQTEYCIDATVKCGFEHGFQMIVPAHTNSTVDNTFMSAENTYAYYNNFIWKNRYAACISFEKTLELMSC